MTEVTLAEAQARLPALIAGLPAGGMVAVIDADQTVAIITVHPRRPATVRPGLGAGRGLLTIHDDSDSHLEDFAEYM